MKSSHSPFTSIPIAILFGSVLISFAILLSNGIIRIKGVDVKGASVKQASAPAKEEAQAPLPQPTEAPSVIKVSVDDDPVLGSKDARITMIEFSDYECPFCKRHYDAVWPELKKNYIDTGRLKLVFRDLPLAFHDPLATQAAIGASCVREQLSDAGYFKFHDEYFKQTKSNGNGLLKEDLYKIASEVGANSDKVKLCLESGKYKDEVAKDLQDAQTAGASGTPTFFIGKTSLDGVIEGARIVGAQPYSAFKTVIDSLL